MTRRQRAEPAGLAPPPAASGIPAAIAARCRSALPGIRPAGSDTWAGPRQTAAPSRWARTRYPAVRPFRGDASRTGGVELLDGVRIELQPRGAQHLLELCQAGGTGDRSDDGRARHEPGQSHLAGLGLEPRRHRIEGGEDAAAAVVEIALGAGAARALAEIGVRAVLAGQEPGGQRIVGD